MGYCRRGSATEYVDHVNYGVVISRGLWVRARSGRHVHCTTLTRNNLFGYAWEGRKIVQIELFGSIQDSLNRQRIYS
jgi:hypothetical protein